ncbi:MAG TPA: hypothetical protein VGN72_14085 [Tepidisphaeraceae bacterium]|nr:hypothetical protein [Tepidisphaeraceae bacterium]
MRRRNLAVLALLITLNAVAVAEAADPPATRPAVPALIVGQASPRSFIVDGRLRFSANGGLAFRVAAEGERQFCAVYDPADGTPLILSDGQQTLVYDLENSRVVRVPNSRGTVRVDWDAQKEKPLSFDIGVYHKSKREKLNDENAGFRIDRFVEAAATLAHVGRRGNADLFAAERGGGSVESLAVDPAKADTFRFTSRKGRESFDWLELEATMIDQPLPQNAFAFPDTARLPKGIHLVELDEQALPLFLGLLQNGTALTAKMGVAAGPAALPGAEWDALRKRDATFGAIYRKALAEQGVELRTLPQPTTTQPAR